MKVVSSGRFADGRYDVVNVFNIDPEEKWDSLCYWLAPPDINTAKFVFDLGCVLRFDKIKIKNTHNSSGRDSGTRRFRLYTSYSKEGPWTQVLESELEDSRHQADPLPLKIIALDAGEVSAHFVKFQIMSWWGSRGGLHFFDIVRPA